MLQDRPLPLLLPPTRRELLVAGALAGAAVVLGPTMRQACFASSSVPAGPQRDDGRQQPVLFCPSGLLDRSVSMIAAGQSDDVSAIFNRMVAGHGQAAKDLSSRYQQEKPSIGFAERSLLLDLVIGSVLAARVASARGDAKLAERAEAMASATVRVSLDLTAALGKVGNKTRDYHVGQGSNMLPLATSYDWLYDHFTPDQRRALVQSMVAYSFVPTLEAMFIGGPDAPKPFWVNGYNNWTTICIGGALGLGLALRAQDDPGTVTAMKLGGETVTRSVPAHLAEFLPIALKNLRRGFLVLRNNDGLQPEGTGYHHDTVLPLYGMVGSMEGAYAQSEAQPASVAEFLADAKQTATVHINAGIHMCGPTGVDWQYADGTWPLTNQPINLLIAEYARQKEAPLAKAAAWLAAERGKGGQHDCALHLLYRAYHEPISVIDAPAVPTAALPTAHYFFGRLVDPAKKEVAINEFVVTWRQRFGDPNAAGVFFKGGDRRSDYHSHMDIGTFLYDALGVRWATDIGNAGGYPYYFRDGIKQWEGVTTYQAYPKRAAAHNTLVVNPAVNDYTMRGVVKNDWFWQFNPDQALGADGTSVPICPVRDLKTDPAAGVYEGSVNLAGAYQRHGIRTLEGGAAGDPLRHFSFDLATGALKIRDELFFKTPTGNEVHWFMNVPMTSTVVSQRPNRILLGDRRSDGTSVYLTVSLELAEGGSHAGLVTGSPEQTMPPGQPAPEVLWGYGNAKAHREKVRKVALRMQGVGPSAKITVVLTPLQQFTGRTEEQVRAALR